jgi:hypothetical protein
VGDGPLNAPPEATFHYATPVQRLKRVRALPAMFGGMFLVLVAAFTLILGFIVVASYRGYIDSDLSAAFGFAVCLFSATCLWAGLPLIYRGTRADD